MHASGREYNNKGQTMGGRRARWYISAHHSDRSETRKQIARPPIHRRSHFTHHAPKYHQLSTIRSKQLPDTIPHHHRTNVAPPDPTPDEQSTAGKHVPPRCCPGSPHYLLPTQNGADVRPDLVFQHDVHHRCCSSFGRACPLDHHRRVVRVYPAQIRHLASPNHYEQEGECPPDVYDAHVHAVPCPRFRLGTYDGHQLRFSRFLRHSADDKLHRPAEEHCHLWTAARASELNVDSGAGVLPCVVYECESITLPPPPSRVEALRHHFQSYGSSFPRQRAWIRLRGDVRIRVRCAALGWVGIGYATGRRCAHALCMSTFLTRANLGHVLGKLHGAVRRD